MLHFALPDRTNDYYIPVRCCRSNLMFVVRLTLVKGSASPTCHMAASRFCVSCSFSLLWLQARGMMFHPGSCKIASARSLRHVYNPGNPQPWPKACRPWCRQMSEYMPRTYWRIRLHQFLMGYNVKLGLGMYTCQKPSQNICQGFCH